MDVIPIEYNELANQVRSEVLPQLSGIPDENLRNTLEILIEGFMDLKTNPYHWSKEDFSVLLKDFPIETYQEFSLAMHKLKLPLGYVLSHLMEKEHDDFEYSAADLLSLIDDQRRISINHFRVLEVEGRDLEETEEKVVFNHIDNLIFSDTVTPELFRDRVSSINHCHCVEVPAQISKLLLLAKTRFIHEVTIREN